MEQEEDLQRPVEYCTCKDRFARFLSLTALIVMLLIGWFLVDVHDYERVGLPLATQQSGSIHDVQGPVIAPLDMSSAATLVSLHSLSTAIQSGGTYEAELALAMRIFGEDESYLLLLDRLIDQSAIGVTTKPELIAEWRFLSSSELDLQSQLGSVFSSIWSDQSELRDQVTVLNEITSLLEIGNLEAAFDLYPHLDLSNQSTMLHWFEQLQTRIETDWVVEELRRLSYSAILTGVL